MEGSFGIGRRPEVLAHRGYHGSGASENSLGAFQAGLDLGADQIETDVRRTRDGVLVMYHDPELPDGRKLSDVDYAQLPLLPDGQRIPTLAETASFAGRTGARMAIELKEQGHERQAVDLLLQHMPLDQLEVISFHRDSIRAVEDHNPDIRTGLLEPRLPAWLRSSPFYGATRWVMDAFNWHPSLSAASRAGADYVSTEHRMVTGDFMAEARERGLDVMAWTVDDPARMRQLIDLGVDGLVTDRPDLALAVRSQAAAGQQLLAS